MKSIIIDDTRLARQELKYLLSEIPSVEVIAEASNAEEGKSLVEEHRPDLIFLDIQMPEKNGFELLETLDYLPEVIFVTAYNNYAIKAFEYNALDYLQKPVKSERLALAIEKVKGKLAHTSTNKYLPQDHKIFVKEGDRCWFINLRDINLFEVSGNYTRIHFDSHAPIIPKSLNSLESKLDPSCFFRANRQQIINLESIEKVEPWFSGTIKLFLKNEIEIELSRRQSVKLKEVMSL
ncbi:LytR/AlgR family response regulator transcription factor [Reichenbachiella versicolor]|uniref:LytR/AlgR family response regulator transcription factor n=1 Tax=Reichenbachiella versicolor TaxID=1821036 RepID=UPI000D6E08E1|nr:LytTR family DNA-binding domain-containing protein [Reichenbachiella versicolor]